VPEFARRRIAILLICSNEKQNLLEFLSVLHLTNTKTGSFGKINNFQLRYLMAGWKLGG
jgi:hypothetical protein